MERKAPQPVPARHLLVWNYKSLFLEISTDTYPYKPNRVPGRSLLLQFSVLSTTAAKTVTLPWSSAHTYHWIRCPASRLLLQYLHGICTPVGRLHQNFHSFSDQLPNMLRCWNDLPLRNHGISWQSERIIPRGARRSHIDWSSRLIAITGAFGTELFFLIYTRKQDPHGRKCTLRSAMRRICISILQKSLKPSLKQGSLFTGAFVLVISERLKRTQS